MALVKRTFDSTSSSAKYETVIDPATGATSCDCNGWRRHAARICWHINDLREEFGFPKLVKGVDTALPAPKLAGVPTTTRRDFLRTVGTAAVVAPTLTAGQKAAATRAARAAGVPTLPHPVTGKPLPIVTNRAKPMLASAMPDGKTLDDFANDDWWLEEKFDGHRVMVKVAPDKTLDAWSRPRSGSLPVTRDLPAHIAAAMKKLPAGTYDGELVVLGKMSSDVAALVNRDKLVFVIFDALDLMGEAIATKPLTFRRAALELAFAHANGDPALMLPTVEPVTMAAVERIWAHGGEGAILKRKKGTYRPGWRSPEWVKVKKSGAIVVTITGFEAGKSGPHSVVLGLTDDGVAVRAKTRNNALRDEIAKKGAAWYVGKRLVLSFIERLPSGKLRHAIWDHLL